MANLIPKTPPAAWVAMARDVLLEEGVQGVKVDRLAQRLGVTKGGFYKHFAHRDALLAQLLALWEADNVFVPALPRALDADAARERLLALTERLIGEEGYDPRFDLAVRDWARVDPAVAAVVRRTDRRRVALLRRLFAALGCDTQEADVRSRVLYYHQVGYYALGIHESEAERRRLLPAYLRILIGAERLPPG